VAAPGVRRRRDRLPKRCRGLMNPNLSSPARSIYVAGRINPAALVLIDLISKHCNRKGLLLGAQTAPFEQNVDYLWANGRTWPTRVSGRVRLRPPSLVVLCLAKPANHPRAGKTRGRVAINRG